MMPDLIKHLLIFSSLLGVAGFVFVFFYPRMLLSVYKRAILVEGGGEGSIPVNTLYTEPETLFSDPLHPPASASKLMTTGVNHDTLMTIGWLDLSKGPLVLQVPDMDGRYYSIQFTDPAHGINFAYVGSRATGTQAGEFFITGPGWKGAQPHGFSPISSPINSVLVVGRTLVKNETDLPIAHAQAEKILLAPWSPSELE